MKKSQKRFDNKAFADQHFNPKLKRMLQILLVIAFAMLLYVIYSSIKHGANPLYVTTGLLVGIGLGFLFARIFKISWDDNARQVAYNMDVIGIGLLVIFIVFDLSRIDLVSSLISGPSVKPTSFALLAGTFYGRVWGIRRNIVSVLKEQKIL